MSLFSIQGSKHLFYTLNNSNFFPNATTINIPCLLNMFINSPRYHPTMGLTDSKRSINCRSIDMWSYLIGKFPKLSKFRILLFDYSCLMCFDQRMSTLTPGNTIYAETLWELLPILNTQLSGTLSPASK
jgi:hypothetical protein